MFNGQLDIMPWSSGEFWSRDKTLGFVDMDSAHRDQAGNISVRTGPAELNKGASCNLARVDCGLWE